MTQQQERRSNPDSSTRDRRYVSRLTHPNIRDSAEQIHFLVMSVAFILVIVIAALLVQGVLMNSAMLVRNVAFAIVAGLFAGLLFGYAKSLKAYLKVETPSALALCFERQRNFWTLLSFAMIIALLSTLIF